MQLLVGIISAMHAGKVGSSTNGSISVSCHLGFFFCPQNSVILIYIVHDLLFLYYLISHMLVGLQNVPRSLELPSLIAQVTSK